MSFSETHMYYSVFVFVFQEGKTYLLKCPCTRVCPGTVDIALHVKSGKNKASSVLTKYNVSLPEIHHSDLKQLCPPCNVQR